MTDVEPVVFAATSRTGRRNALPDILGSTAGPGAADLPDKLAELSVGADDGEQDGESSSSSDPPKETTEEKTEGS